MKLTRLYRRQGNKVEEVNLYDVHRHHMLHPNPRNPTLPAAIAAHEGKGWSKNHPDRRPLTVVPGSGGVGTS